MRRYESTPGVPRDSWMVRLLVRSQRGLGDPFAHADEFPFSFNQVAGNYTARLNRKP
jgi:hypothetical protein